MWGKSTKQRRAARRRHSKYLKAWNRKMKALAFGWMYSRANPGRAPPGVAEWLRKKERKAKEIKHIAHDYFEIEYRLMLAIDRSLVIPKVAPYLSPTGRSPTQPPNQHLSLDRYIYGDGAYPHTSEHCGGQCSEHRKESHGL